MRAKRTSVVDRDRWCLAATTAAGLVLVAALLIGCSDSGTPGTQGVVAPQSEALTTGTTMEPPTMAEMMTELNLRPEQEVEMSAALELWRRTRAAEDKGQRRHGDRGDHSAIMTFIEQSAGFLDNDQFVTLIGLVSERLQAHVGDAQRARGGRRPAGMGGQRIGGFLQELDLSDEQKTAVRDAGRAHREAMRALHEEAAGREITQEMRDRMTELREQFQEELQSILTAEQYARLGELRAERQRQMLERQLERLNDPHDRRIEFLTKVLALTDEQQEQMASIHADARDRQRAIIEGLLAGSITRAEAHEQRVAVRGETQAAVREILTPEQQEILDALAELRKGCGQHKGFGRGPGRHGCH